MPRDSPDSVFDILILQRTLDVRLYIELLTELQGIYITLNTVMRYNEHRLFPKRSRNRKVILAVANRNES
jgi:hypothetical protein